MNKEQANELALKLQARFDVYFKNQFGILCGPHWRAKGAVEPEEVAREAIVTKVAATKVSPHMPGLYAFRIEVKNTAKRFVRPNFSVHKLEAELVDFFFKVPANPVALVRVNEFIQFGDKHTKPAIWFAFKEKASKKQYYHFEFRSR